MGRRPLGRAADAPVIRIAISEAAFEAIRPDASARLRELREQDQRARRAPDLVGAARGRPAEGPALHRRTYDKLRREGMDLEAGLSKRMRKRFPDYASLVAYTD
jgi:hypothetical protein